MDKSCRLQTNSMSLSCEAQGQVILQQVTLYFLDLVWVKKCLKNYCLKRRKITSLEIRTIFTVEDRKAVPVWGWSRPLTLIRLRAPNALEQVINCTDNMSDEENTF